MKAQEERGKKDTEREGGGDLITYNAHAAILVSFSFFKFQGHYQVQPSTSHPHAFNLGLLITQKVILSNYSPTREARFMLL